MTSVSATRTGIVSLPDTDALSKVAFYFSLYITVSP